MVQAGETDYPREMTVGESRVRVSFNPSGEGSVYKLKEVTAQLIDVCEAMKAEGRDPRLCSLAQTAYEEAAMWAVKAATSLQDVRAK